MSSQKMGPHRGGDAGPEERVDLTPAPTETIARVDYFAALALAAIEATPEMPTRPAELDAPAVRIRKKSKARRAEERAQERAERRAAWEAQLQRNAAANGDAYRVPPSTPPAVFAVMRAVCNDVGGSVVMSSFSKLPLELRHRARVLVRDRSQVTRIETRYRVALLIGLSMMARVCASTRAPRVVEGYSCNALCALLRDPRTGRALSRSRVFGRDINAAPIFPELRDLKLVQGEQPGLDAPNVPRGAPKRGAKRGYALNVYYLDGSADEHRAAVRAAQRARSLARSIVGQVDGRTADELLAAIDWPDLPDD